MLSGNGRHRRPRQAPALLVAAGVTGTAIAIPLVAASGASAADGTTWDKVAQCETGGSWSTDNGNGYSGGLLLTQDDWETYGGLQYASSPDRASRSQQIAVAEKILADRGPGAWPTCGPLSGLTKKSGKADVDTGVGGDPGANSGASGGSSGTSGSSRAPGKTDASGTPASSGGSGSGGSDSTDPSGDPGLSDSPQDTGDSSGTSGSPSGSPGAGGPSAGSPAGPSHGTGTPAGPTGKPVTPPAGTGDSTTPGTSSTPGSADPSSPVGTGSGGGQGRAGDPANPAQIVGTSALVDTGALSGGRHRGTSADESPADGRTDAAGGRHAVGEQTTAADSYTVRTGDSLTSIADSLDLHGGWHALYGANKGVVGADPDHIVAGQSLDVPTENAPK
ncbi:transglycosylase family protein [Streptomyces sp. NPDC047017]|uniref:transglycosylase family protein n=1 Tax=Streptomyces sp. NPDC047017 TaxID=3155024 RepID=UPI0033EB7FE9